MIQDIDRPDVNGVPPKMLAISETAKKTLEGITPYLSISTDDNLMSSVSLRGTLEPREQWSNGIFHNASYFIASIVPMNGKRYYDAAHDKVTIYVSSSNRMSKFRKYTGHVDKCLTKFKDWVETNRTK